jgi:hypothetical protein
VILKSLPSPQKSFSRFLFGWYHLILASVKPQKYGSVVIAGIRTLFSFPVATATRLLSDKVSV